jgi:putative component of toxin-antitoxin plasmid stabilization module
MEPSENDVIIFESEDGKLPFSRWLKGLRDQEARAIIRNRINRLRLGNFGDFLVTVSQWVKAYLS